MIEPLYYFIFWEVEEGQQMGVEVVEGGWWVEQVAGTELWQEVEQEHHAHLVPPPDGN